MLALDPSQRCPFEHAGLRINAKYMTAREWIRYRLAIEEAHAATDPQVCVQKLLDALGIAQIKVPVMPGCFSDTENKVFDVSMLADWFTPSELWALVYETMNQLQLSEEKKSKSGSPSESNSALNAADAGAAA